MDKDIFVGIKIPVEDRWIYDVLQNIVETKRAMGGVTSIGREVVNLVKMQLLDIAEDPALEVMKAIIKGGVEETIDEVFDP